MLSLHYSRFGSVIFLAFFAVLGMSPFRNLLLVMNPKIYLGRTLFHDATFGICSFWHKIPKLVLEEHLFIMGSVPKCALFGTCGFWNVSFLERAVFGMCCFWNLPFLD